MIKFDKVSITVGGRTILDSVSLSIAKGEKVVIRGRSGCGKSCLLKSMVGGIRPASGSITVGGLCLTPEKIMAVRRQIAYVAQEPVLAHETVRQDLLLPFSFAANRAKLPDEARISAVLRELYLAPAILQQQSRLLSGGEKQRLVIARAILMGKNIFLADEITSALDPESKEAVLRFMFDNDHTVVAVSHDPDWIAKSERVLTLEDGKLSEVNHGSH